MDRNETVNAAELAKLLAITPPSIRRLVADGVLPKAGRDKFRIFEAIPAFIAYREAFSETDDARTKSARASKLEAESEIAQIELKRQRGETVTMTEFEAAGARIAREVRGAFLAVPGRIASRLPHLSKSDIEVIRDEIYKALTAVADGKVAA